MIASATLTINRDALDALAADLGLLPAAIDRALASVLNRRAPAVMDDAIQRIASRVLLSEAYVADRIDWRRATVARPVAVITARERATRLATYMANQRVIGAPGARGDALRGIAAGFKQAGVYAAVNRGNRKLLSRAFLVPLRAGVAAGGNGLGIFTRTGPGRKDIRHRYGPSVNQLFSGVVDRMKEPLIQSLEDDLLAEVSAEMRLAAGAFS